MNRTRMILALLIAVTAGGVLAYGTYRYLQTVPVETVALPTEPVVVAASDLTLGTEIREGDLLVIEWPEGSAPVGVFSSPDELIGRGLVASLVSYEPLTPKKVAPEGAGAGLQPVIPPGMRAMSVRVNEVIGVAGYVLPGTFVDVVATASPTNQFDQMTSKMVLTNVQVLAAGTRLEQDGERDEPIQVTVVTLLVDPEQAERLALASTEGKIQLALRNPLDKEHPSTPGIRPATLLAASQPARPPARRPRAEPRPAPPPPPPPPPTVEVIRGAKRERTVVG